MARINEMAARLDNINFQAVAEVILEKDKERLQFLQREQQHSGLNSQGNDPSLISTRALYVETECAQSDSDRNDEIESTQNLESEIFSNNKKGVPNLAINDYGYSSVPMSLSDKEVFMADNNRHNSSAEAKHPEETELNELALNKYKPLFQKDLVTYVKQMVKL